MIYEYVRFLLRFLFFITFKCFLLFLVIFRHLEEDAKELTAEALAKMTPEELEFHYFSAHDYDKNSKLDGLEMLKVFL